MVKQEEGAVVKIASVNAFNQPDAATIDGASKAAWSTSPSPWRGSGRTMIVLLSSERTANVTASTAARHVHATYELRAMGNVVSAVVNRGQIEVAVGPADDPDLVIEVLDRAVGRAMSTGRMPAPDAKMSDQVLLEGDPGASRTFSGSSRWIPSRRTPEPSHAYDAPE